MNSAEIRTLVVTELAAIADRNRREALGRLIVDPSKSVRSWDYGGEHFECWTVARDQERGLELVYSVNPFSDRWGCLPTKSQGLGSDDRWFCSLDDAFIACLWDGPLPPGYEVD